jgi:protein-S-isoprenylcysteine O-methyltransferase Ste14
MILKLVRQTALMIAVLAAMLLLPAGRLDWPGAWLFLAELGGLGLAMGFWLARRNPGLLAERMKPVFQRAQPGRDRRLMIMAVSIWAVWFLLMGFERRLDLWHLPFWFVLLGAILMLASLAIVHWTFHENSFASPVVRIQTERGHKVISTGPYALVRHPMYAGATLFLLSTPMMLGSPWGLVLAPAMASLLALRAVREERTLAAGLEGYTDYMCRVRYRLVPGLW